MKYLIALLITIALLFANPLQIYSANKNPAPSLINKSINKPVKAPDKIIVKYKNKRQFSLLKNLYTSKKPIDSSAVELKLKKGQQPSEVINKLNNDANIEYAEPNYLRRATIQPNDAYYSLQWGLHKIQAPAAWDTENGASSPVIIAVIDTGVDFAHPDLSGKLVAGVDVVNNDDSPQDDNGHGTHVAGIAAASTNNAAGIAGVSWHAKIMPIKALDYSGAGYDSWIATGIREAADRGANIINLSLGGSGYSQTLREATDYAAAKGVVVIAAAGNTGDTTINYPAGNPNVIGVGATDQKDNIASFSTHNSTVDVAAPGVEIASTYWYYGQSVYAYSSGTSMATPMVAGLAALIKSKWPQFNAGQVTGRIIYHSDDKGPAGRDDYYGYGRINALRSLSTTAHANTRLTINASRKRIQKGKAISIYGRLSNSSSNNVVLRYKKDRSKWRTLKRIAVNSSSYKTNVKLMSASRYVFAIKQSRSSSRAMVVYATGKKVKKGSKVSINANRKRVRKGSALLIYGRAKSGSKSVVIRYKKDNSKWKTLKRTRLIKSIYKTRLRLNTGSRYVFSVKADTQTSRNMLIYSY